MSTDFKIADPVDLQTLYDAGATKSDGGTETYFPVKLPSHNYVWVQVDEHGRVDAFTRFGLNDPEWMLEFVGHENCISEYEDGYWSV